MRRVDWLLRAMHECRGRLQLRQAAAHTPSRWRRISCMVMPAAAPLSSEPLPPRCCSDMAPLLYRQLWVQALMGGDRQPACGAASRRQAAARWAVSLPLPMDHQMHDRRFSLPAQQLQEPRGAAGASVWRETGSLGAPVAAAARKLSRCRCRKITMHWRPVLLLDGAHAADTARKVCKIRVQLFFSFFNSSRIAGPWALPQVCPLLRSVALWLGSVPPWPVVSSRRCTQMGQGTNSVPIELEPVLHRAACCPPAAARPTRRRRPPAITASHPPPPATVLYMLWAYTPDAVLEAHGITYYPAKYWAVALPAWVSVTVVFVFWAYERLGSALLDRKCCAFVLSACVWLCEGTPASGAHRVLPVPPPPTHTHTHHPPVHMQPVHDADSARGRRGGAAVGRRQLQGQGGGGDGQLL